MGSLQTREHLLGANDLGVFDHGRLRDTLGGDDALIAELIAVFVEDSAAYLRRMCDARESQDTRALFEAAHALKGASRVLTADRVATLVSAVEQSARKGEMVGADRIEQVQAGLAEFQNALARQGLVAAHESGGRT